MTQELDVIVLQPIIQRNGHNRRFWGFQLVNMIDRAAWVHVASLYTLSSEMQYWLNAVGMNLPEGNVATGKYALEMLQHLIVAGWQVKTTEPMYRDELWFSDDGFDDEVDINNPILQQIVIEG